MYQEIAITNKSAVKISVNVSNFTSQYQKTLSLLDHEEDSKEKCLSQEIQKLRKRFGLDILKTGNEL
jgi:DNA polymerase-4